MHTSLLVAGANADTLAREVKKRGLPGRCSAAVIRRKRRQRAALQEGTGRIWPDARMRLHRKLAAEATAEVDRRGGETVIEEERREVPLRVADRDPFRRVTLVTASGWRQYSKTFGARRASLAYLYGVDDSGPWAVRVPGTTETVDEALAWLEPSTVSNARQAGKRVRRQGDVYAVETTTRYDGTGTEHLPEHHQFNPATRFLTHHPSDGSKHRPVKLTFPVRFVRQNALEMGRGAGRGPAD